jgi:hypothetical protein
MARQLLLRVESPMDRTLGHTPPSAHALPLSWTLAMVLLAGTFTASGQKLDLPARIVLTADHTLEFNLALKSNDVKLTALQWDLVLPVSSGGGLRVDARGTQSDKIVHCALQAGSSPVRTVYRCILAGGTNRISSGPVARFTVRLGNPMGANSRARRFIHVQHALGVSADLKQTIIDDTQAPLESQ